MDLAPTAEQTMLVQAVRRLVGEHVAGQARQWDAAERFPTEVVAPMASLGLWGIQAPAALGGSGLGALELALVVEEIAAADGSLALVVASHNGLCLGHLATAGSAAQKQRFVPHLASGKGLGAWALTEPNSGSDAVAMATVARRAGAGWVLSGSKVFITQGSIADTYVVLAVTDRAARNHGVTAFVVDRGTPGLSATPMRDKVGMRASDTALIALDGVEVGDDRRLGAVGAGFIDTLKVLDGGRITIAALAVGLMRGALAAAAAYAKQRQQFGEPIANFQAVQWKLANLATELAAARLMTHAAAGLADAGRPFSQEASMAKLFASEAAVRGCEQALQVHGGYGYTGEFVVGRHWRDAKLTTIGEGTSEIQRSIIARRVLRATA